MRNITLNEEQLDRIINELHKVSPIENIQYFMGVITLGLLVYTIYLQTKTTAILAMENKFKMMPVFELKPDKGERFTLIAKNNIAYDIKLVLTGDNIFHLPDSFLDASQTDIIVPEMNFQTIPMDELKREKPITKGEKIEFIKIIYSNYTGRSYFQKIYFVDNWLHISRPFEVKKSIFFSMEYWQRQ